MMKAPAPPGFVWVCAVCGKRAKNKGTGEVFHGWDVSCYLNSILCREESIELTDGQVPSAVAVDGEPPTEDPA